MFEPGGGGKLRWKQLLTLWVKMSSLPCFSPFSPKEEEIRRRCELTLQDDGGGRSGA